MPVSDAPAATPISKEKIFRTKSLPVKCGTCHSSEQDLYSKSLHGKAIARGDPLAPHCVTCHGNHDILPVKDPHSAVTPLKIPFVCGQCHQEGTPVSRNRQIAQDNILGNYSESIHGEALLKKGLAVAPTCATCHTAHSILPHTDPASSINRKNIAATCTKCHSQIETVHRKVIRGELWEKQANVCHLSGLPSAAQDPQCLLRDGHGQCGLHALPLQREVAACARRPIHVRQRRRGRPFAPRQDCLQPVPFGGQRLARASVRDHYPKVDCTSCHDEIGKLYATSIHGQLNAKNDPNAPTCKECHGTHGILGKQDPQSSTFAVNVPNLCARCHREGQKAAVRYTGTQHEIISNYTESIHGTLLKNGLTVTATCTSCHTAHHILPRCDPASSVNANNVPNTCGQCHHGIEEQFENSIHSKRVSGYGKPLPVCNDCHTAHSIHRTDENSFKLNVMGTCGRCHEKIAETYFETYHGKVSRLGYTKAAKCYDCHGPHDVLKVTDPRSHLSRANVAATCQKCHAGATRRFAGYLTHATHHDPKKYPFVFYTFWGMTGFARNVCRRRHSYLALASASLPDAPRVESRRSGKTDHTPGRTLRRMAMPSEVPEKPAPLNTPRSEDPDASSSASPACSGFSISA